MNQQRSRRFRAAREAKEKEEEKQEFIRLFKKDDGKKHEEEPVEEVVKKYDHFWIVEKRGRAGEIAAKRE